MTDTTHRDKAAKFQQQVWDFGHNAEISASNDDFEGAARWIKSQELAILNMNYHEGLWLEELAK
jgi:hypothetical protein